MSMCFYLFFSNDVGNKLVKQFYCQALKWYIQIALIFIIMCRWHIVKGKPLTIHSDQEGFSITKQNDKTIIGFFFFLKNNQPGIILTSHTIFKTDFFPLVGFVLLGWFSNNWKATQQWSM